MRFLFFILCYVTVCFSSEVPLVVFVTGYNNASWVTKTLDSIFFQRYKNFRVLYIDDCSTDGAEDIVKQYIKKNNLSAIVTFIQNSTRKRKLANLYRGFYLCADNEVVVFVDGDDWLVHDQVFDRIVAEYQDPQVWMTYGNYINVPKKEADFWRIKRNGSCNDIPKNIAKKRSYRTHTFLFMHVRTCYAWLLKQIRLKDLIAKNVSGYIGDFYPASNDLAVFFPVVEMATTHVRYIKDILYIRNVYSEIVGFKVDRKPQIASAFEIRKKGSYPICKKPIRRFLHTYKKEKADIVIPIRKKNIAVMRCIEYVQHNVTQYENIFLLYDRSLIKKEDIRIFAQKDKAIIPVGFFADKKNNYEDKLQLIANYTQQNYFLFISEPAIALEHTINCGEHIYWLEKTFSDMTIAYNNSKKGIQLADNIYACVEHIKHMNLTTHYLVKKTEIDTYRKKEDVVVLYIN